MNLYSQCFYQILVAIAIQCLFSLGVAQAETGYVQILADPNVRVLMDAELVGVTNRQDQGLTLTNISSGRHQFRFEKPGFKPMTTDLVVSTGEVTVYTLHGFIPEVQLEDQELEHAGYLEARIGAIELTCLPVYCQISIPKLELDNYTKSSAPLKITEVLARSYQLEIRVGDAKVREAIKIAPNTTLKLFADFTGSRPRLQRMVVKQTVRQVQVPKATATTVPTFDITLEQPIAVLLDNADAAYPQQGLVEASSVFEMPIEGGVTRLLASTPTPTRRSSGRSAVQETSFSRRHWR